MNGAPLLAHPEVLRAARWRFWHGAVGARRRTGCTQAAVAPAATTRLRNASSAPQLRFSSAATIRLRSYDSAPQLRFGSAAASIDEGGPSSGLGAHLGLQHLCDSSGCYPKRSNARRRLALDVYPCAALWYAWTAGDGHLSDHDISMARSRRGCTGRRTTHAERPRLGASHRAFSGMGEQPVRARALALGCPSRARNAT